MSHYTPSCATPGDTEATDVTTQCNSNGKFGAYKWINTLENQGTEITIPKDFRSFRNAITSQPKKYRLFVSDHTEAWKLRRKTINGSSWGKSEILF